MHTDLYSWEKILLYVYPVGALGIDNIKQIIPLSKKELENDLKISLDKPTALMTFHPVTLDSDIEIKKAGDENYLKHWLKQK